MHNRKLNRLTGFDYSTNNYYFITICVHDHSFSFGMIENKTMQLSAKGIIAKEQWIWLGQQYSYLELVSFVVMPDHIHGIIHIDSVNKILKMKIKPLPELIGAYKTTVSKRIHLAGDTMFKWQKSYHDHIIRNTRSLNLIKKYIMENPEKWVHKNGF